jgi:bla regulator protein BlaR1
MLEEEKQILKHLPIEAEKIRFSGMDYILEELDGTGNKEIIVPYKEKDIENAVFLLVINYDDNKSSCYKLKGDGDAVERLEFVDINNDNKKEILLGTQIGTELFRLNVFSYKDGSIDKEFSYSYSKLELLNNKNKEKRTAIALWTKNNGNCYKVAVVRWNGSELVEALDLRKEYFIKVIDYYKELTIKEKDNPLAWYYLADAQIKGGYKKDALTSIAKGVALNKDYPTKQEFEALKIRIK